jgi:thiol-disulfide isomerase/thioredoxin
MIMSRPTAASMGRQQQTGMSKKRFPARHFYEIGTIFAVACVAVACVSPAAGQSTTFTMSPIDPPQQAPEIAFLDRSGHSVRLADFRGRIVVLNLWATWCVPCVSEMPSLDRLAARFANEPLAVIAVALDREGKRTVDAFYRRIGLGTLPQYFDPRGLVFKDLGSTGLPTTVVIDHEGRQIGRLTGPIDWDSAAAAVYLAPLIEQARAATLIQ